MRAIPGTLALERIMRRFVLLQHDLPADAVRPSHLDLMLSSIDDDHPLATDTNAKLLWTWEVPLELLNQFTSEEPLPLRQLADHRLAYLTYEGPLSGNRGSVQQIDAGTYTLEGIHPQFSQQAVDHPTPIRLNVFGKKLRGNFEIFYRQNQWWLQQIFARS